MIHLNLDEVAYIVFWGGSRLHRGPALICMVCVHGSARRAVGKVEGVSCCVRRLSQCFFSGWMVE